MHISFLVQALGKSLTLQEAVGRVSEWRKRAESLLPSSPKKLLMRYYFNLYKNKKYLIHFRAVSSPARFSPKVSPKRDKSRLYVESAFWNRMLTCLYNILLHKFATIMPTVVVSSQSEVVNKQSLFSQRIKSYWPNCLLWLILTWTALLLFAAYRSLQSLPSLVSHLQ